MYERPKVIRFPADARSPLAAHTGCQEGMPLKLTHQHPTYASDQERLEQLQDLKKLCLVKLHGLRSRSKTA